MIRIERDGELLDVLFAIDRAREMEVGERLVLEPGFNNRQQSLFRTLFTSKEKKYFIHHYSKIRTSLFGEYVELRSDLVSVARCE